MIGGVITIQFSLLNNNSVCLIHIYGACIKIEGDSYYEDCLDSEGIGGMLPIRAGLVGVE